MQETSKTRQKRLFQAIISLQTATEAEAFLRDLCTRQEIDALSERWQIVRLLDQGLTYREIAPLAQTSTTTVTRVAQWLMNGAGGYRLVLDRLYHHHGSSSRAKGLS